MYSWKVSSSACVWISFMFIQQVDGQGCIFPSVDFPKVKETDPAGLVLLNFSVALSREVWAVHDVPLPGYVAVERENDTVRLVTLKPLDLEEMNRAVQPSLVVLITAVNEFDPFFIGAPYEQDVEENSAVGTTVFSLQGRANDDDFLSSQQPISQFRLHSITPQVPGVYFAMTGTIQGIITTQRPLDYEALLQQGLTSFILNVSAEDNGDPGPRSSFTTIKVNVVDVDDESPAFVYDCGCAGTECPPKIKGLCRVPAYSASISAASTGELRIQPNSIFAVDGDMLNVSVTYGIVAGSVQNYSKYFAIDPDNGVVTQTQPLADLDVNNLVLTIQATEVTAAQRQAIRGLTISVNGRTASPYIPETVKPDRNTTAPTVGAAKEDDSIALWVLLVAIGSCLLLGILVAVGVYIFLRKRQKTDVHPDDTQSSGPSNVSTEEEILDAYASEATESKWGTSNLDLSVKSAYGPHTTRMNDVVKRENYINGQMTNRGNLSPRRADIAVPLGYGGHLPPLNKADMVDTSTETEETDVRKLKRKPRRRKDRSREEEIYDGTRTYEMEADPSFFTSVPKQKVKRNRRSFNKNAPDYWITVPNEY